jgi:hypothetical protein
MHLLLQILLDAAASKRYPIALIFNFRGSDRPLPG